MSSGERLAVLGFPVSHSLSPAMQGAALTAAGLPWSYEAISVPPAELPAAVRRLRSAGYHGFNVTIPHKVAILPLLDRVMLEAQQVGAVNTVVRVGGSLIGHNTDPAGFLAALGGLEASVEIRQAVLFGAGGAARAVASGLVPRGVAVVVVNRDPARAAALAARWQTGYLAPEDPALLDLLTQADLVINATSLGMGALADRSPLPVGARLRAGALAIDLVYGHQTPFLQEAERQGCRTAGGEEMLIQQGAAAFRLWTGIEADLSAMRRALDLHREDVQVC